MSAAGSELVLAFSGPLPAAVPLVLGAGIAEAAAAWARPVNDDEGVNGAFPLVLAAGIAEDAAACARPVVDDEGVNGAVPLVLEAVIAEAAAACARPVVDDEGVNACAIEERLLEELATTAGIVD